MTDIREALRQNDRFKTELDYVMISIQRTMRTPGISPEKALDKTLELITDYKKIVLGE